MKLLDRISKKVHNYMLRKIKEAAEKEEQDRIKWNNWIKEQKEKERIRVEVGKPLYHYTTYHFNGHRYYRVHPDTSTSYSDRPYLIHDPNCPQCEKKLKGLIISAIDEIISDWDYEKDNQEVITTTNAEPPEVDNSKEDTHD